MGQANALHVPGFPTNLHKIDIRVVRCYFAFANVATGNPFREFEHPFWAFSQDLKGVLTGRTHHPENGCDVLELDVLVEQVAHGAGKNAPGLFPSQGLAKAFVMARHYERGVLRVSGTTGEAPGHASGIAVRAALADWGAPRYGVPRLVGPFNFGGHVFTSSRSRAWHKISSSSSLSTSLTR